MIRRADDGDRFWECKSEYYHLLADIQRLSSAPSEDEAARVLAAVIASSKRDGVADREWVKQVIDLLTRMSS